MDQAKCKEDFNGDLWSLSPEEMKKLRSNVGIWEYIKNTGKGGYGNKVADKLNDYIDQAGKLEELTDELYEGLTGISFDSMYDSFVDTLMDMNATAEDMLMTCQNTSCVPCFQIRLAKCMPTN